MVASEFIELVQVHIVPAYCDERIHVYLARGLTTSKQNLDQDKIIDVVRYPLNNVIVMIGEGIITDDLTIISIQQARAYIQNTNIVK